MREKKFLVTATLSFLVNVLVSLASSISILSRTGFQDALTQGLRRRTKETVFRFINSSLALSPPLISLKRQQVMLLHKDCHWETGTGMIEEISEDIKSTKGKEAFH